MTTAHADVLASVKSWSLQAVVACREVKGKTEITYKGESQLYPHWLALRKINLIGASHTCEGGNV